MGNANTSTEPRSNFENGDTKASSTSREKHHKRFSTFTPKQKEALLKRYNLYDSSSGGVVGIPLDVCLAMPEFVGNKLIGVLIHDFANSRTGCMHQEEFLNFCSFLHPLTSIEEKKKVLYDCFNVYGTDWMTHDEIFRLYKVLLGHTVSDDHILALTFKALQHPSLKVKGQIKKFEFMQMASDSEIEQRLTVIFNVPPG
ncbi:unnamed protein product [Lymnaea stagnalis]|uniref:Uncharacterized protein n=1 Tax=Lymnaea stagnalis TaxID=6523 RepID=A0AAV2H9M7_LYMST